MKKSVSFSQKIFLSAIFMVLLLSLGISSIFAAVTMRSFTATQPDSDRTRVELVWETATEKDSGAFYVQRAEVGTDFAPLNSSSSSSSLPASDVINVLYENSSTSFVPAEGDTSTGVTYTAYDETVEFAKSYKYRLIEEDINGVLTSLENFDTDVTLSDPNADTTIGGSDVTPETPTPEPEEEATPTPEPEEEATPTPEAEEEATATPEPDEDESDASEDADATATAEAEATATAEAEATATAEAEATATAEADATATAEAEAEAAADEADEEEEEASESEPTETPAPTETPVPTATPQPTATQTPQATNTPAPTATLVPTQVPANDGGNTEGEAVVEVEEQVEEQAVETRTEAQPEAVAAVAEEADDAGGILAVPVAEAADETYPIDTAAAEEDVEAPVELSDGPGDSYIAPADDNASDPATIVDANAGLSAEPINSASGAVIGGDASDSGATAIGTNANPNTSAQLPPATPTEQGRSGPSILLWLAFGAGMLVFGAGIIGSIIIFTRQREEN